MIDALLVASIPLANLGTMVTGAAMMVYAAELARAPMGWHAKVGRIAAGFLAAVTGLSMAFYGTAVLFSLVVGL